MCTSFTIFIPISISISVPISSAIFINMNPSLFLSLRRRYRTFVNRAVHSRESVQSLPSRFGSNCTTDSDTRHFTDSDTRHFTDSNRPRPASSADSQPIWLMHRLTGRHWRWLCRDLHVLRCDLISSHLAWSDLPAATALHTPLAISHPMMRVVQSQHHHRTIPSGLHEEQRWMLSLITVTASGSCSGTVTRPNLIRLSVSPPLRHDASDSITPTELSWA